MESSFTKWLTETSYFCREDLASWLCSYLNFNVQILMFNDMFGFEHYLNQSVTFLLNYILFNARFTVYQHKIQKDETYYFFLSSND